jgi:hypothetical protein
MRPNGCCSATSCARCLEAESHARKESLSRDRTAEPGVVEKR